MGLGVCLSAVALVEAEGCAREGFVQHFPLTDPDGQPGLEGKDEMAGDRDGNRIIDGVRWG